MMTPSSWFWSKLQKVRGSCYVTTKRCYVTFFWANLALYRVGPSAQVEGTPPWSPPTLGRPSSYILSSHRLRNLSLFYKLALAITEQSHSAAFVYCRLHLRVIVRLLASFSCSFFNCVQETIFVIRLTLHWQGW